MNYETAQQLSAKDFKRRTGVYKRTFKPMLHAWHTYHLSRSNAGRPPKLCRCDQLLVALQYWREYRTYFHIAGDWEVSESTVCRIVHQVETALMNSGLFRLPGQKSLLQGFERPDVVVMDVTETPIERPQTRQKAYYSGKKKRHTFKCQIIANRNTLEIICLNVGPGRRHDFQIFKGSGIHIHPDTESLQDSGYQGIAAYHANSYVPLKKPQHGELTSLQREYNRALSQERMGIEHINRSLKIFRILSERYRNRRRRYALRCNLIAAIYNYELSLAA
ncbi:IS5 family transposase [Acaryochloris marina]|nr:IS5 family transposase [Acaryochloris marina]